MNRLIWLAIGAMLIAVPAHAQSTSFGLLDFSTSDQGMWGDSNPNGFSYDYFLGIENVHESFSFGGISGSANATIIPAISTPFGTIPAVRADTRTGIELDIGLDIDALGLSHIIGFERGDVDASLSYSPTVEVPEMFKNVHRTLNTQSNITGTPSLATSFTGFQTHMDLEVDVSASFTGRAALIGLGQTSSSSSFGIDFTYPNLIGYNANGENKLQFAGFSTPGAVNGVRVDLPDPLDDFGYLIPSNPNIFGATNTIGADGTLTTGGSDNFLEMRADLDALFSYAVTSGATTDLFGEREDIKLLGLSVAEISYDLVGIDYGPNFGLEQQFTLDPGLGAKLTFDREVSLLNSDGTTTDVLTWEGRWDDLPALAVKDASIVTVDVEFSPDWQFRNQTFLTVNDELVFRLLGIAGSIAGIGGIDEALYQKSFPIYSHPSLGGTQAIEVFDDTFALGGGGSFFFNDAFTLAVATTDTSWLGGDDVFSNAAKWDGGVVPGDASNVLIPDTVSPSTITLDGAQQAATLSIADGSTLVIPHNTSLTLSRDIIANNGLIHMNPSLGLITSGLYFNSTAAILGNGEILIDGSGVAIIGLGGAPSTDLALLQGATHTIRVADATVTLGGLLGTPDFDFFNFGTVIADGSTSDLTINVDALHNAGLIQANNGANIDVAVSSATGTNEGIIRADNGSTLNFIAGKFDAVSLGDDSRDGQVIATSGSTINVTGVPFVGSNFSIDAATLNVDGATNFGANQYRTTVYLTNSALMTVTDSTLGARVNVDSDSTLAFSGNNFVTSSLIDNNGTLIVADGTTTVFDFVSLALPSIQPVDLNNNGTIEVQNGATFDVTTNVGNIQGDTLDELVGGTWRVISTGQATTLDLDPRYVVFDDLLNLPTSVSGTLRRNAATVLLSGAGASFNYFNTVSENDGSITFDNGHAFATAGDFENRGALAVTNGSTLQVAGAFSQSAGATSVESASTFNTGGAVTISGGTFTVDSTSTLDDLAGSTFDGNWRISSRETAPTIVDLQGHAITSNTGSLEVVGNMTTFDALRSLESNSGSLTIAGHNLELTGALSNTGSLDVVDGGRLYVNGNYTQTAGSLLVDSVSAMEVNGLFNVSGGTLTIDSTVTATQVAITGGTVNGSGDVAGDMVNSSGTLNVGNSPGTLELFGNYTQTAGGTMEVDIDFDTGGTLISDLLIVHGDASIGGALVLNVTAAPPFEFTELIFLQVDGTLAGMFDGLAQGDLVGIFGDSEVRINYAGGDGNDVSLIVPEPGTGLMLFCLLGGMAMRRRRVSRVAA